MVNNQRVLLEALMLTWEAHVPASVESVNKCTHVVTLKGRVLDVEEKKKLFRHTLI